MTIHMKNNLLVLTALQGGLQDAVQALFGSKIGKQNLIFLLFTNITHLLGLSRTRLSAIITILLYLTVLHCWLQRKTPLYFIYYIK